MVQQVNVNFIINEIFFLFTTVWEKEKLHEGKSAAKKKEICQQKKKKNSNSPFKN